MYTKYGDYRVSLIEQGEVSRLLWEHGNKAEIVPLPEDVIYAPMMLSERDNDA